MKHDVRGKALCFGIAKPLATAFLATLYGTVRVEDAAVIACMWR
jgi:hypothetical protein